MLNGRKLLALRLVEARRQVEQRSQHHRIAAMADRAKRLDPASLKLCIMRMVSDRPDMTHHDLLALALMLKAKVRVAHHPGRSFIET